MRRSTGQHAIVSVLLPKSPPERLQRRNRSHQPVCRTVDLRPPGDLTLFSYYPRTVETWRLHRGTSRSIGAPRSRDALQATFRRRRGADQISHHSSPEDFHRL